MGRLLLNTSDRDLPLADWQWIDKRKAKMPLSGTVHGGDILGVSHTKQQAEC